jgi:hypothetical protein
MFGDLDVAYVVQFGCHRQLLGVVVRHAHHRRHPSHVTLDAAGVVARISALHLERVAYLARDRELLVEWHAIVARVMPVQIEAEHVGVLLHPPDGRAPSPRLPDHQGVVQMNATRNAINNRTARASSTRASAFSGRVTVRKVVPPFCFAQLSFFLVRVSTFQLFLE